jgi:hypothetical protein
LLVDVKQNDNDRGSQGKGDPKMKYKIRSARFILTCLFVVFPLTAFASDNPEVFVVATDIFGNSSYAMSYGDGTLAQYEDLVTFSDWRSYSYSNGLGDFDNDGDFDLILARGMWSGPVLFYEKIGPNNQFVQRDIGLSWSGAKYPAGMAVADFNEDGHLDFIITYYNSTKCDLYTGLGNYEFTMSSLAATAPSLSFGADATDFNNDGHADFVVAPYSGDFYINLGTGDGSFNTTTQANLGSVSYFGVAAADFDRDGNIDLVATSDSLIDIYYGTGTGTFEYGDRILDSGIYNSPVDNYDFNGDGHQDIVLGAYSNPSLYTASYANGEGIAVMLGDGQGTFGDPVVYGGFSTGAYVTTISAPPAAANIEPVAVIYCDLFETPTPQVIPEVTAGQEITLDGLESYDEDGKIISYMWNFGDGSSIAPGDTVQHVYAEAGEYTITLTVTDNGDATSIAELTLLVVPPRETLKAKLVILPRKLNLKSKGRWMNAYVKFPKGCDVTRAEITSLVITKKDSQFTIDLTDREFNLVVKNKKRWTKRRWLKLKFDRQAFIDAISGSSVINAISGFSGKIVVDIQGEVFRNGDPVDFSGKDKIRIKKPYKKKKRSKKKNR